MFYWVEDYLIKEKDGDSRKNKRGIVQKLWRTFRKEVCSLTTLLALGKIGLKTLQSDVMDIYNLNIFKFKGFDDVKAFMTEVIALKIEEMMSKTNVTKSVGC